MKTATDLHRFLQEQFSIRAEDQDSLDELTNKLASHLNRLINEDFAQLVRILYRIDIDEKKIRALLKNNPDIHTGEMLAGLIIERQLEKIKSRDQFKNRNEDPEEDKW